MKEKHENSGVPKLEVHTTVLGVILVGRPLLEQFPAFLSFPDLWIMALTAFCWNPKKLEIAL